MNETEIRNKLPLYADGELSPADTAEVETYLRNNPAAQAEVAACQKLRLVVGRVLTTESIPVGLEDRLRSHLRGLRVVRGPRVFRLGLSGLAAAAVLMLTFFLWPEGTPASAAGGAAATFFTDHHWEAAYEDHPDDLGVRDGRDWEEFDRTKCSGCCKRLCSKTPFPCSLPDMSAMGYRLQGATVFRLKDDRVVQAYFRCADEVGSMFSIFVVEDELRLFDRAGKPVSVLEGKTRVYNGGRCGKFSVVSFVADGQTYILCCGKATPEQLVAMADRVKPGKPTGCNVGG
jgi:hypothetical protein